MTQDLYTVADVKRVREALIKEQRGVCPVSKESLVKPCLDHAHDDYQLVRGVLSHGCNIFLGNIENAYKRRISWWLSIPLSELLRNIADYLDKPEDCRFRHTGWLKKVQTEFNKLSAGNQNEVLKALSVKTGKNPKERKELFRKALLTREYDFSTILKTVLQQEDDK